MSSLLIQCFAVTDGLERSLGIKIGVITIALLAAGYFAFLRADPDAAQPDTPESAVPYLCVDDAHVFDVTPAAFDKMWNAGEVRSVRTGDEQRGNSELRLRCPQCGTHSATLAVRCANDQTVFPRLTPDGATGTCPKCKWYPQE